MLSAEQQTNISARFGRRARLCIALLGLLICFAPTLVVADFSRPAPTDQPTIVTADIYILDIDEVNTASQSFEANVFIELSWQDPRLVHKGEGKAVRKYGEIWSPQVQIANMQRTWKTYPDRLMVSPNGTVSYTQRYWGSFSQPLRLKDFPFDRQNFTIQLITATHTPEEVQFLPSPENGISDNLSVADWTITSFRTTDETFNLSSSKVQLASITAVVEAKRKSDYFLIKVILPLIFIVMMSWVVFWIDPQESGTQISVAVTSMLTLIAYRFAIGADLPKISYLTRLDFVILGCTVLVFASLVEVVITSTYAKIGRIEVAQRIDHWSRVLFPLAFCVLTVQSLGGFF